MLMLSTKEVPYMDTDGLTAKKTVDVEQMNTGAVRVHIRLSKRVHDDLKMLGDIEGRSVSDIIRQVINAHLRNNSESINEAKKER